MAKRHLRYRGVVSSLGKGIITLRWASFEGARLLLRSCKDTRT